MKRRAAVVKARTQIDQSFRESKLSIKALLSEMQRLLARIDKQVLALIRALGWWPDYHRCLSIPGIGPLNAAALVSAFHRGAFAGKYKGKRKLTKCGEAEIRRLLFCAAQGARSYPLFDDYYQNQLNKGLSKIAAKVVLARKIVRIAFTLLTNQQSFKKKEIAYR